MYISYYRYFFISFDFIWSLLYNVIMINAIMCISEFATKLVAGLSGLVVAVLIIVIVWAVAHKKSK